MTMMRKITPEDNNTFMGLGWSILLFRDFSRPAIRLVRVTCKIEYLVYKYVHENVKQKLH